MKKIIFALVAGVLLSSCSGLTVISDLDKSVDFAQYKTFEYYGWTDNSDQLLSPFDKERIEEAFGNEFLARDLKIVEKGQGELIVSLYIVTQQKTQTTANTTSMGGGYGGYYGYGPGYGWGGGHSTTTYSDYDYTEGSLIVSVFDGEKEQLIWESAGKGTINENPKNREANIPKAVAKIMNEYPVQAASK
jgi:hypothetical protein